MPDDQLSRFAGLIRRYHGTLDLVSGKALEDLDTLVAEAREYATVIAEVAGDEPTIVDLGSGVGLPGVVVAVTLPGSKVHLVERRRRRSAFLSTVVGQLGLSNARVWGRDVKDVNGVCAEVVTAQAVSSFSMVADLTRHLHRDPCYLVSRKGPDWKAELGPLQEALASLSGSDAPASVADAERHTAVTVAAERALRRGGSLVALRMHGGPGCRSSG